MQDCVSPDIVLSRSAVPVRKVRFSFSHQDMVSKKKISISLLNYVIPIGEIESINLQSVSASTCGHVLFRKPEHAAQLLRQKNLKCAGAVVRIWEAFGQPTHGMNILNLNDHCLQKVFTYLDVDDLAWVAEVNQRFKENAQAVFPLKYKSLEYQMFTRQSCEEAFLKNFVFFLEKLDIDFRRQFEIQHNHLPQLELISPYCSNTLEKLHLANIQLRDATLQEGRPILNCLRSLHLDNCELSSEFIDVLSHCNELRTLAIFESTGDWQFSGIHLPKLENVFCLYTGGFDERQMKPFLQCNPQLKP